MYNVERFLCWINHNDFHCFFSQHGAYCGNMVKPGSDHMISNTMVNLINYINLSINTNTKQKWNLFDKKQVFQNLSFKTSKSSLH